MRRLTCEGFVEKVEEVVGFEAELLAAAGWPTSIVTQDQVAGTQLARTGDLADANTRLLRAGVTRELRSLLREAGAGHAVLEDSWTGEQRAVDCVLVVHCGHRLPDQALYLSRPGTPRDTADPEGALRASRIRATRYRE